MVIRRRNVRAFTNLFRTMKVDTLIARGNGISCSLKKWSCTGCKKMLVDQRDIYFIARQAEIHITQCTGIGLFFLYTYR